MVELKKIQQQLEAILREGVRVPDGLSERAPAHDAYNLAQGLEVQTVALGTLAPRSIKLHQALVALDQIKRGTYGTCLACEEPISEKRIAAVPWSPFCIECGDLLDQHRLPGFEHLVAA